MCMFIEYHRVVYVGVKDNFIITRTEGGLGLTGPSDAQNTLLGEGGIIPMVSVSVLLLQHL